MTTRPALKAKMGSITYYQTTYSAQELSGTVRIASETDAWASATIEERLQRELNRKRVMEEIVPYLANHPDRFFGSIIVLVEKGSVTFEPLNSFVKDLPKAYQAGVDGMGFLTIENGDHIALDGQHRLAALNEVKNPTNGDIGPFQYEVVKDQISVIILEFKDHETTRRIFNKVNRNAKPTGRADNILLSEDDGYAIITRWLIERKDAPLAAVDHNGKLQELVNWRSNTLTKRVKELTTVSAVYEIVKAVLKKEGFPDLDEKSSPVRPSGDKLEEAYEVMVRWFETFCTKVDAIRKAIDDPSAISLIRFADSAPYHQDTLLLRPVGQIAVALGVLEAMKNSRGALSLDEAFTRVNKIDWSADPSGYWRDVIVRADGRMIARSEAYNLAAKLIAYLIGDEYLVEQQRTALWTNWNSARGKDVKTQPEDIKDPTAVPEDLPPPIR